MNKFQVIWDDYEDDCSHCAVFESAKQDPLLTAQEFLSELGDTVKIGYQIENGKAVDAAGAVGHRF